VSLHLSDRMPLINRRDLWQQGQLVEVVINDLSDTSDGVGRWGERVVFVRILFRVIPLRGRTWSATGE